MHAYEVRPRKDKRGVDLILSRLRACELAVFFGKLPHKNNSNGSLLVYSLPLQWRRSIMRVVPCGCRVSGAP
jgi:hypothetical protein